MYENGLSTDPQGQISVKKVSLDQKVNKLFWGLQWVSTVERTMWKKNTRMSSSLEIWGIFNGVHLAAFPRITKIYVKGEMAPGEYWDSMNNCFFWNFHKIHFLNLQLCICGSIYNHGNTSPSYPKAMWNNTQNRKNTVLGHYSIKTYSHLWSGGWGGRNSGLTSRQFMSQLFNYLTSHSAWTSILRMFSPWTPPLPSR